MMKKILAGVAALGLFALLAAGGGAVWANSAIDTRLTRTFEAHSLDLAVPMPLTEAELEELRAEKLEALGDDAPPAVDGEPVDLLAGVDLDALALERARARGKHLVEARFACVECHGRDFTGGTMVDDGAMGTWLGPNLTGGEGSPVADYTIADWDHIVRHGLKADGTAAIMPSEDYLRMSDRELSDIVAYIQSFDPVAKQVPAPSYGPIGSMLLATGKLPLSAEAVADHQAAHPALPPETGNTVEFGKHLVQVCTGCHRHDLSGGPIAVGPPSWPPASNLTPHGEGIEGWTYEQFTTVMRTGERPDGSMVKAPMDLIMPYAREMTDVELQALWTYVQSVAGQPTGT